MLKKRVRRLTLALTLLALTGSALHASTTNSSTTTAPTTTASDGVTGGDPEPTSPDIVQIILQLLQLA